MTETAILIPTICESTLEGVLKACLAQVPRDQVWVLGYGNALDLARRLQVRCIDLGTQTRKSTAINCAVNEIHAERYIILDADAFPAPGWFMAMQAQFSEGKDIFSGAADIAGGNFWNRLYNISLLHEFTPEKPPSVRRHLPALTLGFTAQFFIENGPMDESIIRSEDYEWTLRASSKGLPLYFCPAAVVDHWPVNKSTFRSVMQYWFNSGADNWTVRNLYSDLLHTPKVLQHPWLVLLLSPLLALKPACRIFFTSPKLFWQVLLMFPFIYLTKVAWCFGVFAFSRKVK